MIDPTDIRLFTALKRVCGDIEGVDQACRDAVEQAISTGDPLDLRAARDALDRLDGPLKETVFRKVHQQMATDLSAVWDALPGAPGKQRAN
ncbi:MAG: hypothetical protein AAGC86_04800 [Pseudomonadota bacterium]